jgi:hypothetical protein
VGLNSDAEEFRRAIINIYPRLSTTTGYTLWNVKKDKTFEKLPVKVNSVFRFLPTGKISLGKNKTALGYLLCCKFLQRRRCSSRSKNMLLMAVFKRGFEHIGTFYSKIMLDARHIPPMYIGSKFL